MLVVLVLLLLKMPMERVPMLLLPIGWRIRASLWALAKSSLGLVR